MILRGMLNRRSDRWWIGSCREHRDSFDQIGRTNPQDKLCNYWRQHLRSYHQHRRSIPRFGQDKKSPQDTSDNHSGHHQRTFPVNRQSSLLIYRNYPKGKQCKRLLLLLIK